MSITYFKALTPSILQRYGNRKLGKYGKPLISFFYDVQNDGFLAIPDDMEHVAFVSKLLGIPKDKLAYSEAASKLIPVYIFYDYDETITSVSVGVSSNELAYHVRHNVEWFKLAYKKTLRFIEKGGFRFADNYTYHIEEKFAA